MKNLLFQFFIISLLFACNSTSKTSVDASNEDYERLVGQFERLQMDDLISYVDSNITQDWFNSHAKYILNENPTFNFELIDSINTLFIPSLLIPIEKIENNNSNIISYLNKGSLSINEGLLYLIYKEQLIGKIAVHRGLYPMDFNANLNQFDLDVLTSTELLFRIIIKTNAGYFPLPGIVFFTNNQFKFITMENEIFPLEDMVSVSFKSEKAFSKFISDQKK